MTSCIISYRLGLADLWIPGEEEEDLMNYNGVCREGPDLPDSAKDMCVYLIWVIKGSFFSLKHLWLKLRKEHKEVYFCLYFCL